MKNILTTISVGVLSAASMLCPITAHAQTTATSDTSQGSLGKRYVGASFAVVDGESFSGLLYGTGLGVNVPVTSYLDARLGYSYEWYKNDSGYFTYKANAHNLNTDFVLYKKIAGGLKPFLSAGLGYTRTSNKLELHDTMSSFYYSSPTYTDDVGTWDVTMGIEIPFRWVAFTPTLSYDDDFEDSRDSFQSWSCGLAASSWITPKVGVSLSAEYSEPKDTRYDLHTWAYTAGLRIKF